MRIAVDESGHPTVTEGSSPTFSPGAVLFEHTSAAEACDQTVAELNHRLNVTEFHYVDLTTAARTAFLEAIVAHDFGYVVQTFVKSRRKHGLWSDTEFFYDRVASKFAERIEEYLRVAYECCQAYAPDEARSGLLWSINTNSPRIHTDSRADYSSYSVCSTRCGNGCRRFASSELPSIRQPLVYQPVEKSAAGRVCLSGKFLSRRKRERSPGGLPTGQSANKTNRPSC